MKENRKTVEKINNVESWFFEKTSKTDKTLACLTKKKMIQRKKKVRFIKGHQNQQTLTENNKKKVIRFNKNQK